LGYRSGCRRASVGSRVRLQIAVASDLAAERVDQADFELALLNLVLNARDAMPNGGMVHIDATNDRLRLAGYAACQINRQQDDFRS
jgi:signal transduction histidine kinase